MDNSPLWPQFRRLLLGAVVESLVAEGVDVDVPSLTIRFDEESAFRVPRLDNYMRFSGTVAGRLRGEADPTLAIRMQQRLSSIWRELVSAVDIPIGDGLSVVREEVCVEQQGGTISIRFDLSAD